MSSGKDGQGREETCQPRWAVGQREGSAGRWSPGEALGPSAHSGGRGGASVAGWRGSECERGPRAGAPPQAGSGPLTPRRPGRGQEAGRRCPEPGNQRGGSGHQTAWGVPVHSRSPQAATRLALGSVGPSGKACLVATGAHAVTLTMDVTHPAEKLIPVTGALPCPDTPRVPLVPLRPPGGPCCQDHCTDPHTEARIGAAAVLKAKGRGGVGRPGPGSALTQQSPLLCPFWVHRVSGARGSGGPSPTGTSVAPPGRRPPSLRGPGPVGQGGRDGVWSCTHHPCPSESSQLLSPRTASSWVTASVRG